MTLPTPRWIVAALLLLSLTFTAMSQERREVPAFRAYGEPANAQDGAAVQRLIEQYKDAWARLDTQAFIALHAEDTEWINAYARLFQGARPLADFLETRLFPAFDPNTSKQEVSKMRTISTRYLGDDAAVVHMYTESDRGASRNEGEKLRRTHFHLVLGKQTDGWKVVHTAIMDAR
jgi:uncharacterized protein (TIGR02246 family)